MLLPTAWAAAIGTGCKTSTLHGACITAPTSREDGVRRCTTPRTGTTRPSAQGSKRLERGSDLEGAFAHAPIPAFIDDGFARPPRSALVNGGQLPASGGAQNSARSAAGYGLPANGVGAGGSPQALHLRGDSIIDGDLLRALDTGLYTGNLWCLNCSDRAACRMTDMTGTTGMAHMSRYACYWVGNGGLVAPTSASKRL